MEADGVQAVAGEAEVLERGEVGVGIEVAEGGDVVDDLD